MRTTLDLPDGLLRRAKFAAVRKGLSLKRLIAEALEHELEAGPRRASGEPLRLPLVSSKASGSYELKADQIADILIREEVAAFAPRWASPPNS